MTAVLHGSTTESLQFLGRVCILPIHPYWLGLWSPHYLCCQYPLSLGRTKPLPTGCLHIRGKESRKCCLEAVSSLLLSVSTTSFAWPTDHQLRSCTKNSSTEPNQQQFTQQWNFLLTWTGVLFYLKLYAHHALQAPTLLLILSSWGLKEKETSAFPHRQAECPWFLPKTGWRQQDWTLSWAPVWLSRQPWSMSLFRATPSTVSGTQVWSETASNTEVCHPVSAHRPPSAGGITVGGDNAPCSSKRCSDVGPASA